MSSKSKRKPVKLKSVDKEESNDVKDLQLEIGQIANAFQLIAQAQHPGNKADIVLASLQFLDKKHLAAVTKLKEIAPELFDKPKEETKEPELAQAPSSDFDHEVHTEQAL